MSRIIAIIGVLSILLFPNIAQAACKHKSLVISTLVHMGYMPMFQAAVGEKVVHIYIDESSNFVFFKIEHDDTVCQMFGGRQFMGFKRMGL